MARRCVSVLLLLLFVVGCMEGKKDNPTPRTPSLYTRLGGEPGITKLVDGFIANMISSKEIRERHKAHFIKGDVTPLKRKLVDQIGEATGGPQKYKGLSMSESHKEHGITDSDFNATVAALVKAMDDNGVAKAEQDELLAKLGPMRKDIVTASDGQ